MKQSICGSMRFSPRTLGEVFVAQAESTAPWWQLLELQARAFEASVKTNPLGKGERFLLFYLRAHSHPRPPETESPWVGSRNLHVKSSCRPYAQGGLKCVALHQGFLTSAWLTFGAGKFLVVGGCPVQLGCSAASLASPQ